MNSFLELGTCTSSNMQIEWASLGEISVGNLEMLKTALHVRLRQKPVISLLYNGHEQMGVNGMRECVQQLLEAVT
jgi:hypothetical protein